MSLLPSTFGLSRSHLKHCEDNKNITIALRLLDDIIRRKAAVGRQVPPLVIPSGASSSSLDLIPNN